ncbi:Transposon Ty3-G Gag-Pol polyprotein [Labeo rohita]|uniref:ribonuclease H n=1 Tax=Labeo rohita TaxID=84645 RepID=A0ABQ8MEK9_LABRO|nr:Transposon Ty3-G Gag-Pol polyprotein [Labeo rohita]
MQHLRPSTRRSDAASIIGIRRSHNTCAPVCSETTSSSRRSPLSGGSSAQLYGSDSLDKTASVVRGFLPPATHCFSSDGTPTLGTPNVTPLRPLAENFSDWLNLPNPSRWLLRTIRLGYAIQFARRPPKFRGVLTTSVQGSNTAVLRAEIAVLLAKDAIETVPSAEMKKGFYSPYFIVPKKGGGLRPILDLRVLNRALLKLPFKMLTLKHILTCVRIQDWFVAIDLKDAYFHVSILPRHRPFLRFAFEGRAYQYKVLPFGLSLSPRVFTKVAEAALSPPQGNGRTHSQLSRRLADSGSLVGFGLRTQGHGSQPFGSVGASGQLGKEQTLPGTEDLFSRCRAGLGQYVCASLPGACTVSSEVCGNTQVRVSGPPKTGSEAPRAHGILSRGHATGVDAHETAAALASYSSPQVGVASRHISGEHHTVVSPDTQPLDRHYVPTVRSSTGTGVQTHHCHHRCFQDRLGCHLQRAGSFRGLDRPPTVLAHKLSGVVGSAPRPEEVPFYDSGQARVGQNRQHYDCGLHQPPGRCTLLSHVTTSPPPAALESTHRLKSLRATHIPGEANRVADSLSRQVSLGGEWRLHPSQSVQLIWDRFGQAQVDLFASPESTHCQLWYGLTEAPLGIDALAHSWPRGRLKYAFPPNLVLGPGAPGISPSLAHSSEEGPPFSGEGHNLAPTPRSLEPPPLVPGRDQEDFRDLSPSVVNTLLQARAPSTRRLYDLKWRIFVNWCSSHGKDPRSCGINSVLSFLQEGLDRHLSASTLKVHVAAISANHDQLYQLYQLTMTSSDVSVQISFH